MNTGFQRKALIYSPREGLCHEYAPATWLPYQGSCGMPPTQPIHGGPTSRAWIAAEASDRSLLRTTLDKVTRHPVLVPAS